MEIIGEQEEVKALSKEEEIQYEYEERVGNLREAAKEYLERWIIHPPSRTESLAGSVINPDENMEGREREVNEIVREIEIRRNLDHSTQTRSSENVHFQRQPLQKLATADGSAAVTSHVGD